MLLQQVTVIDPFAAVIEVTEVFADDLTCIAVAVSVDMSEAIEGGGFSTDSDHVIELAGAVWGYSWIGSGWRCDGPHPFSG